MKKYLIIGGSTGIGHSLAQILAQQGNEVHATYNKTEDFEPIQGVSFHSLNVMDDQPDLDFVGESLDGLIYCPGSINLKPFGRLKPESFIEDFKLQVVGAIKVIQACLPTLKKSEQASIVLFSTVAVQHGFNFHTQVATSKGAIEGLARSLAAEFAPKIRVNVIAPSLTNTPLANKLLSTEDKIQANADRHPLKRIGHAQDSANMAEFLLSEKSSWISGQVISVDGGMSRLKV